MSAKASSRPSASPMPRAPQSAINNSTVLIDPAGARILAVADIRGRISGLNDLARDAGAKAIIHTGDFGFFEASSLGRINDRTLRHLLMYSPLIPAPQRNQLLAPDTTSAAMRATLANAQTPLLSEFPLLLSGKLKLNVPVFTVWGACEDVAVLEKFRSGQYDIDNLHVLDEATTRCLDVGGIKLRLLGLGGAFVPHRMFDNGDGQATIAGGQGTMWTTALQIGELVDTSQKVFDPTETRLLVTHAAPGREGLMAQLALVVKADLTISAGLHFRYSASYNEFSVQGDLEGYRQKLMSGKESFERIYDSVKAQVDAVIDENQRILLEKAIMVAERVLPPTSVTGTGNAPAGEEPAWKNCWNWNLCDAAYGSLALDIKDGRVSAELRSQGFNFAYRRTVTPSTVAPTPTSQASGLPSTSVAAGTRGQSTPASSTPGPGTSTPAKSPVHPGAAKDQSPPDTKVNGAPQEKSKKKDKKDKAKEREKDAAPKSSPAALKPPLATPTIPAPVQNTPPAPEADPTSPVADGGARTPTSRKAPRNPWTLFMKVPPVTTEGEIRDFFNDAKSGITRVNYPPAHANRPHRIVYVEFGDEQAMKAGQAQHAERLHDMSPHVVVAEDRGAGGGSGSGGGPPIRGGSGGRGRGGNGFAQRAMGAAGLAMRPRKEDGGE